MLALIFNLIADINEKLLLTPHVYLYVVGFIDAFFVYFRSMRPLEAANASFCRRFLPIVFSFIKKMYHERGTTLLSFAKLPESTVEKFNILEIDDLIPGN